MVARMYDDHEDEEGDARAPTAPAAASGTACSRLSTSGLKRLRGNGRVGLAGGSQAIMKLATAPISDSTSRMTPIQISWPLEDERQQAAGDGAEDARPGTSSIRGCRCRATGCAAAGSPAWPRTWRARRRRRACPSGRRVDRTIQAPAGRACTRAEVEADQGDEGDDDLGDLPDDERVASCCSGRRSSRPACRRWPTGRRTGSASA